MELTLFLVAGLIAWAIISLIAKIVEGVSSLVNKLRVKFRNNSRPTRIDLMVQNRPGNMNYSSPPETKENEYNMHYPRYFE